MFDDAWRTMKYRFYDPKMHGNDWDAMRAKYQPLVEYVGDRQELLNIDQRDDRRAERLAHGRRAAGPRCASRNAVSTGHLGLELEADDAGGPLPRHARLRRRSGRQGLGQGRPTATT